MNRRCMQMLLVCGLMLGMADWARAHEVSGDISGEWADTTQPFYVVGDCNVINLTIRPGVRVLFTGAYTFQVVGILNAVGAEGDSIYFEPAPAAEESWNGISFIDSRFEQNALGYCVIRGSGQGGVFLQNSMLAFHDCTIEHNTRSGHGAGLRVLVDSPAATGTLVLENCTIANNAATGSGGGVRVDINHGSVEFLDCVIMNNTAGSAGGSGHGGGGISLRLQANTPVLIERCDFTGNLVRAAVGGFDSSASYGGGLYAGGGPVTIHASSFNSNQAFASVYWIGSSANAYGSGMFLDTGTQAAISNTMLRDNTISGCSRLVPRGGGIYMNGGSATLTNCTILRNQYRGIQRGGGTISARNSIIYFNTGGQVSGTVQLDYCNIENWDEDETNISRNPVLDAEDRIQFPSPCIDAGDPDPIYNDVCFPPSLGEVHNDMGAHGGPGAYN